MDRKSGSAPGNAESIAERLASLSPAKRALLEKSLKQRSGTTIPQRERGSETPLSFAQELLWLLDQVSPGQSNYNIAWAVRMKGQLNTAALQQTLDAVVARHEALRTTFGVNNGQPFQVIADPAPIPLERVDLGAYPVNERAECARQILEKVARIPFDLAKGPVLRASLIRIDDTEHILLLVVHHIAFDGWSGHVLTREFAALYNSFVAGETPTLPPPPIQYADYAVWQRERLQGELLEQQLAYWKRKLEGMPTLLELPTDRPRPPVQTYRGAAVEVMLPTELGTALKQVGQDVNATLFMVLLAAFNAIMSRYCGQDDIPVGTPIAHRIRPELEGLIGYFANTLVLRTDLSGDPTFRELIQRVSEVSLEAYSHQEMPFDKLVVELRPQRDLSYSPLFQVMFVLQNTPRDAHKLTDLTLERISVSDSTSKFDLTMAVWERAEGLRVWLQYNTDLFEEATAQRMLGHFRVLLEAVAANPDLRLSELPLLTPAEREQVLNVWNDTATPLADTGCVHQLVEATAKRTPKAVAVTCHNGQLTYQELNARANRLARMLHERGVGPDTPVGIYLDRCLELPVALLGTLKAGGACVPLDPAYPTERLQFMLEDTKTPLLLTRFGLSGKLPPYAGEVLCVDAGERTGEAVPDPECVVTPDNVAYILFTSGSTGKPRGVQLTHRGLVNHHIAAAKLYDLQPGDRVLQFSSLSFDIAVEEIYPTWTAGGTLVLRPGEAPLSGREFLQFLRREKVTVLDLPTAYWHEWVNELAALGERVPEGIRTVIVGGERAQPSVYNQWLKLGGADRRWINTYGPTETSIIATAYEPPRRREITHLPIGKPIANTRCYLLDRNGQPVPIGVPGELYIGGEGLARGYLNQPELTAERFVPDPFGSGAARLYRTGDVARFLPDGNIEFVGRTDHQVKIRGFRVEPGEIEAALAKHPAVRESLVVAREVSPGEKRLVAYVVKVPGEAANVTEMAAYLRERVPEYMVPGAILFLDAFPLTPNGKVDRARLPEPEWGRAEGGGSYVGPRDALETQLVRIWEKVLHRQPIGVTDDFFALGGHSLLGVRLFTQIEKALGQTLPLSLLFQARTVEHLANALRDSGCILSWSSVVPINAKGTKPPIFCVQGGDGEGSAFLFGPLSQHLGEDQPFYGIEPANLQGKALHTRIEEMAAAYLAEIRTVQQEGPYYLGGYCFGGTVALEMARQLRASGEEVALLILFDSVAPDPNAKPEARGILQRLARGLRLARRSTAEVVTNLYLRSNRPLPRTMRMFYRRQIARQASKLYVPQPYEGWAVLFRRERLAADPLWGWGNLVRGDLQVFVIQSDDLHTIIGPGVPQVAAHLRECLEESDTLSTASNSPP